MPTKSAAAAAQAIDDYIAKAKPFAQPILTHLREVVHSTVPEVEEAVKWSMPFFLYRGIILANMAAFKEHCSFGIWKEQMQGQVKDDALKDKGEYDGGRFAKITSIEELPSDREIRAVLLEAAGKIERGERTRNWEGRARKERVEPEVPEALAAALKKNKGAEANFKAMSASCRREYCDWIAEAKREETRDKRVTTAVEWIAEGKQRNWKYQNC